MAGELLGERDLEIPLNESSKRSASFAHVILTRFNVRFVDNPNADSVGVDAGWLADRFVLFERYCLPSVLAQSCQNFSWILFFDAATPKPYAERARALAAVRAGIFPTFCETLPLDFVQKAIREVLPSQPEWLLTTRLDNDDGLNTDFVATVQSAQAFDGPEVLNCPIGIILRGDRAYRRRDLSNAYISLSEPSSDFRTVLSISSHIYAHEFYPVRQVASTPMWLQIVHTSNISNRVRGWRVRLEEARMGFASLAGLSEAAKGEPGASIFIENVSLYLIRSLRDLAVRNLRRVLRAFGVDLRRKVPSK